MALPFSYEGKRVVVSGGGGAGMGAAAVEGLAELGAEIHVLDLKDPPVEVASHQIVDLRDRDAVAAAIDTIGGQDRRAVQRRRPARAAVPRRRHDARELRRAATPHVAGRAVHDQRWGRSAASPRPRAAATCSTSRSGCRSSTPRTSPRRRRGARRTPTTSPVRTPQSKEALIIWTMKAAMDLNAQGIRLNCISPGPTDTPMMPAFEDMAGGAADHRPLRPGSRPPLDPGGAGLADDLPQQRRRVLHLGREPQHRRRHRLGDDHRPARARLRPGVAQPVAGQTSSRFSTSRSPGAYCSSMPGLDPVVRDATVPLAQRDAQLATGQVRTEAPVHAAAEGEVPVDVAVEAHVHRVGDTRPGRRWPRPRSRARTCRPGPCGRRPGTPTSPCGARSAPASPTAAALRPRSG